MVLGSNLSEVRDLVVVEANFLLVECFIFMVMVILVERINEGLSEGGTVFKDSLNRGL